MIIDAAFIKALGHTLESVRIVGDGKEFQGVSKIDLENKTLTVSNLGQTKTVTVGRLQLFVDNHLIAQFCSEATCI